jgi:hypothetical protein
VESALKGSNLEEETSSFNAKVSGRGKKQGDSRDSDRASNGEKAHGTAGMEPPSRGGGNN